MLFQLFYSFLKIGLFTFGGGYAMIPLIEREVITNKKWIAESEFLELLTSVFVGYKMRGYAGALAAISGVVLPSFVIILLVAIFFSDIRHNPVVDAAFRAMRPAVVALIVAPVVGLARGMRPWLVAVSAATALAVWWLGISPVYLLIAGAAAGLLWSAYTVRKEGGR